MGWTYAELFAEVDRREQRRQTRTLAVLLAAGVPIDEAQSKAAGLTPLTASASADSPSEPGSRDYVIAILEALTRRRPR